MFKRGFYSERSCAAYPLHVTLQDLCILFLGLVHLFCIRETACDIRSMHKHDLFANKAYSTHEPRLANNNYTALT